MNDDEQTACEYLRSCGFVDPVYEPDGQVPPDFLLSGRIAVEARRLNQMHESDTETAGLEEISIPLAKNVAALLKDFGPPVGDCSWFVRVRFKRPFSPWKQLRGSLRKELQAFAEDPSMERDTIRVEQNLTVRFHPASGPQDQFLEFGGYTDQDAGGWVVPELERNLRICLREKMAKVSSYRNKYNEWWLVLIDRIAYGGIDDRTVAKLSDRLDDLAAWDRVLLVNPLDATHGVQIWPPGD